jgi:hypothetical protein
LEAKKEQAEGKHQIVLLWKCAPLCLLSISVWCYQRSLPDNHMSPSTSQVLTARRVTSLPDAWLLLGLDVAGTDRDTVEEHINACMRYVTLMGGQTAHCLSEKGILAIGRRTRQCFTCPPIPLPFLIFPSQSSVGQRR